MPSSVWKRSPRVDTLGQLGDGLRLVAGRFEVGDDLERGFTRHPSVSANTCTIEGRSALQRGSAASARWLSIGGSTRRSSRMSSSATGSSACIHSHSAGIWPASSSGAPELSITKSAFASRSSRVAWRAMRARASASSMPRNRTSRSTAMSIGSVDDDHPGDGIAAVLDRAAARRAPRPRSVPSVLAHPLADRRARSAGCVIALSSLQQLGVGEHERRERGPVERPSSATTSAPNRSTIATNTRRARLLQLAGDRVGVDDDRPRAAASAAETVDFPEPMPPVRPTTIMSTTVATGSRRYRHHVARESLDRSRADATPTDQRVTSDARARREHRPIPTRRAAVVAVGRTPAGSGSCRRCRRAARARRGDPPPRSPHDRGRARSTPFRIAALVGAVIRGVDEFAWTDWTLRSLRRSSSPPSRCLVDLAPGPLLQRQPLAAAYRASRWPSITGVVIVTGGWYVTVRAVPRADRDARRLRRRHACSAAQLVAGAATLITVAATSATSAPANGLPDAALWIGLLVLVTVTSGLSHRAAQESARQQQAALDRVGRLAEANALLFSLQRVAQTLPASLDLDDVLDSTRHAGCSR